VKLAHAVTCIKISPFSFPIIENFVWIKTVLRVRLKGPFFSCPKGDYDTTNKNKKS
jgi:hypothetical protein